MNKLEIVQRAILESGIDEEIPASIDNLKDLVPRQRRFVDWASEAWSDIQRERNEWEWRRGYGVSTVYPRLKVLPLAVLQGVRAYYDSTGLTPFTFTQQINDQSGSGNTLEASSMDARPSNQLLLSATRPLSLEFGLTTLDPLDYFEVLDDSRLTFNNSSFSIFTWVGNLDFLKTDEQSFLVSKATSTAAEYSLHVKQDIGFVQFTSVNGDARLSVTVPSTDFTVAAIGAAVLLRYNSSTQQFTLKVRAYNNQDVTDFKEYTAVANHFQRRPVTTGRLRFFAPQSTLAMPGLSHSFLNPPAPVLAFTGFWSRPLRDEEFQYLAEYPRFFSELPASLSRKEFDAVEKTTFIEALGNTIIGQTTGVVFNVMGKWPNCFSGRYAALDVTADNSNDFAKIEQAFKTNEVFADENGNTFNVLDWGDYSFSCPNSNRDEDRIPDLDELWYDSFKMGTAPGENVNRDMKPLTYVKWPDFMQLMDTGPDQPSDPRVVTETPDGRVRFYPPLNRPKTVSFTYTKKLDPFNSPTPSTAVPNGLPEKYHMAIVWRALMYCAEFDHDTFMYQRALKRYMNFKYQMDETSVTEMKFSSGFTF